jgi:dolichol-phosphate mannosyltransferase
MEMTVDPAVDVPSSTKSSERLDSKLTVVLPTLDEEDAIGLLIDELKQNGYSNILVVDGRSTDGTVAIAQDKGARTIVQHGSGKRDALESAIRSVKTPYLLIMDADMTYDPGDIKSLLDYAGDFDQVVGARDFSSPNMPRLHKLGNRVLTFAFNIFFGTKLRDVCSGMYLMRTTLARKLDFIGGRLAIEEVILAQIAMSGRVTDVPINYRHRTGRRPSTQTWRQGLVDLATIFTLARRYNPIMLFSASSALALVPAVILLAYAAIENYLFRTFHSGIALLGVMLLLFASQGLAVTTLSFQMRRIERMLRELSR